MMNLKLSRLGVVAGMALAMCSVTSITAKAGDWYVGGSLGFQIPETIDNSISNTRQNGVPAGTTFDREIWKYEPEKGLTGTLTVGKYLRRDFRVEGHLSYTNIWDADITGYRDGAVRFAGDADGEIHKTQLLFSALYDFHGVSDTFIPYVGVGLGWTWFDLDNVGITRRWDGNDGVQHVADGREGHFTYAFHVGADFPIRENLFLTSRYTLSNREEMTFDGFERNNPARDASFDVTTESGLSHVISFGLKYKFGGRRETYKN